MVERDGGKLMSIRDRLRDFFAVEEVEEEEEVFEPEYEVPEAARAVVIESKGKGLDDVLTSLSNAGFGEVEASRVLYYMEQYGEVGLVDSDPPRSLVKFVSSWSSAWFWLVLGFQVIVALSVFVLPQVDPWIYVRYISGAVYVLYVPGAVFIEALYPKRDELEDLERFALGVGLSLALVPLVGLVLNYTPWGIRLNPIFAGLTLLVVGFSCAAVIRKYSYHLLTLEARR
jgi:hypothetical protein